MNTRAWLTCHIPVFEKSEQGGLSLCNVFTCSGSLEILMFQGIYEAHTVGDNFCFMQEHPLVLLVRTARQSRETGFRALPERKGPYTNPLSMFLTKSMVMLPVTMSTSLLICAIS